MLSYFGMIAFNLVNLFFPASFLRREKYPRLPIKIVEYMTTLLQIKILIFEALFSYEFSQAWHHQ